MVQPHSWRLVRLYCRHYGPFEDLDISFDLPTRGGMLLIEGPNGSGKTSLLEALAGAAGGVLGNAQHSRENCKQRFTRQDGSAGAELEHKSLLMRVSMTRDSTRIEGEGHADGEPTISLDDSLRPSFNWAAFSFRSHSRSPRLEADGPGPIKADPLEGALSFGQFANEQGTDLGKLLLNIDYQRTGLRVEAEDAADESKRASLLAQSAALGRQIESIAYVFGQLTGGRVQIEMDRKKMVPRLLFNGVDCPLELLGEGYRHTIAWAADLLVRLLRINWTHGTPFEQPFWLLLDEVDQSLHPSLQIRFLPAIRRLFPNAFIVASTHSPFTVASVGEGQVISLQPTKKPAAVLRPLAHGQSLERVVEEIFSVDPVFLDAETREAFDFHQDCLHKLAKGASLTPEQKVTFLDKRAWLRGLNEEVAVVLSMRERPLRDKIQALESAAE